MIKKEGLATLLSITGAVGVLATAYLTRRYAIKEVERHVNDMDIVKVLRSDVEYLVYQSIRNDYHDEEVNQVDYDNYLSEFIVDHPEIVVTKNNKHYWLGMLKHYKIPIVVGMATLISVLGSSILNKKVIATFATLGILSDKRFNSYKRELIDKFGKATHSEVIKGLAKKDIKKNIDTPDYYNDGWRLYYEENVGFFRADPEKVAYAYSNLNQRLHMKEDETRGYFSFISDFLIDARADIVATSLKPDDIHMYGWSYEYLVSEYGHPWINMTTFDEVGENGDKYTVIVWEETPIKNAEEYEFRLLDLGGEKL